MPAHTADSAVGPMGYRRPWRWVLGHGLLIRRTREPRRLHGRCGATGPFSDGGATTALHRLRARRSARWAPLQRRRGLGDLLLLAELESPDVTIAGLQLTSPTAELAEQFLTWRHRPDVTRWFLQQRIEDTDAYVADWAAYDDHDHHRAVAVLDGVMVGQATLGVVDGMGQSGSEAEFVGREGRLSYFVHPDHAGRGIATVLAREALANAFGRLGLRRVQAGCFADNVASWRVLEKLGMRREHHGVKDSYHAELGWVDGYTYAVLAEEWRG